MEGFYDPKTRNGLSIPSMSTFSQDLGKQLKQSAGIAKFEVVKLGNPAATSSVDAIRMASNPNYLYYTTEGEEGAGIGTLPASIFPKSQISIGATFLIVRVGNRVSCLATAGIAEEIMAESTPIVSPNQTPVTTSQLDFAVLQPYVGTMYGVVKGAIYGDIGVADISTADMSDSPLDTLSNPIDIPTNANKAIGVLVQLDPATSTLSYKQSVEFPASLSLAQAYQNDLLPLRDEGKYRTGYIKLSAGVTSLSNANVWPCPEFFPNIPTPNELVFDAPTELTVASGEITVTQSWHTIDTEGNTATDELDTINGLEAGRFYFFTVSDASRITKFIHGTGNIRSTTLSDVDLSTVGFWVFSPDGTNANILTHSLPNAVQDWGSWPDNSLNVPVYDNTTGEMYYNRGDYMRIWANYYTTSSYSTDMTSMMNVVFDDTTSRTVTINSSSIVDGHSIKAIALQIQIGTPHKILLPASTYWGMSGTNRAALVAATTDRLWATAVDVSGTTRLIPDIEVGITYAAS
jgi:hypothetical protein